MAGTDNAVAITPTSNAFMVLSSSL